MTPTAREMLLAGKPLVTLGAHSEEPDLVREAIVLLDGASEDDAIAPLAFYYLGYANYRLTTLGQGEQRRAERSRLPEAIRALRRAIALDPAMADAYALLGFCYGLDLRRRPLVGLFDAPASGLAFGNALRLAPRNPRVWLLHTFMHLMRPALFGGGDTDNAIAGLERAAELFAVTPSGDELQPDWGEPETHTLLGALYGKRGDTERARAEYEHAIALDPAFVRPRRLLAQLEAESLASTGAR